MSSLETPVPCKVPPVQRSPMGPLHLGPGSNRILTNRPVLTAVAVQVQWFGR